VLRKVPAPPVP